MSRFPWIGIDPGENRRVMIAALSALALGTGAAVVTFTTLWNRPDGEPLVHLVLVGALGVFALGAYAAWPSRWNVVAHIQVGFCVAAYVIPVFFADVTERYPPSLVRSYAVLCAIGAALFLPAVVVGRLAVDHLVPRMRLGNQDSHPDLDRQVLRRVVHLTVLCAAGMALSFQLIGFIPILTTDPLAAKFLRGEYQQDYLSYAALYRMSYHALYALLPVALIAGWITRRTSILLLGGLAFLLLLGAGNRAQAFAGLVIFVGLICAQRRSWTLIFVLAMVVLFPLLGSAFFYLLGNVLGLEAFKNLYTETDLFKVIAASTADVTGQLSFFDRFSVIGQLTHGRTFYGGLIPYHYEWNPSIWSLSVLYPGQDVSQLAHGGLRLSVPLWGYTAFGWPGVVGLSVAAGLTLGVVSRVAAREVGSGSLLRSAAMLILYATLGLQLANFYLLSLYSLPAIAAALAVAWPYLTSTASQQAAATVPSAKPEARGSPGTRVARAASPQDA